MIDEIKEREAFSKWASESSLMKGCASLEGWSDAWKAWLARAKQDELSEAAAHAVNMYDQYMTGKQPILSREFLLDHAIGRLRRLLGDNVLLPEPYKPKGE